MKFSIFYFHQKKRYIFRTKLLLPFALATFMHFSFAQNTLPLTDMSFFQSPGTSWSIAGDVKGSLTEKGILNTSPGTGVLVNITNDKNHGKDLLSNTQHGDMDLELDYMMAKGSNSGIYMQGRYEIQLLDSWGVTNPTSGDNGGIYERWDDSKPEGQQGYEGHAPRQNAGKAPGLWQHMRISFQAPRFSAAGQKIEDAKILHVELNGVPIQESVDLSGPTRGALSNDEVATGPLRFQGDHGSVAFKNIRVTAYDKPRPELLDIRYSIYKGRYDAEPAYKTLPPEAQGSSVILSSNVSTISNEFLIRYTGTIRIKEPGEYNFNLNTSGGRGLMRIKDQVVIPIGRPNSRGAGKVTLAAGDFPFELFYSKFLDFAKPSLGLAIAGPGIREYLISDANVAQSDPVNPILIHAPVNIILRSFVDIDTFRVTHAVNVGSAQQVHYTYDMDKGTIVQLWRGDFLDATPMWHSRGDGSSRATGMVLQFGKPMPALQALPSAQTAWSADTTGSGYRPKGYILDDSDRPTFRYIIFNTMVNDVTRVLPAGHGIHREISLQGQVPNLYLRLAQVSNIEAVSEGLYLVNDRSYYLQFDDPANSKPVIREANGRKEILLPVQNKMSYSILF